MVLPDGFIQFNDKPEGGGVSATQKNSELKHSSATFAIHRPIRPKGLAADGDGASSWCCGRVRVRQAGGLFYPHKYLLPKIIQTSNNSFGGS